MSRPQKRGLDYFPLDIDIFENDKLFDIQNDYGCLGEVIYLRLLCLIYKNGYYYKFESIDKLSAMLIKSIGNKWIGNKQTVIQVIRALVEVDLFSRTLFPSNVITSESIQRRYLKAIERRQSINKKEFWLLESDNSRLIVDKNVVNVDNNSINVDNNSINVDSNATKVKESKLNNIKENILKESTFTKSSEIRELAKKLCPSVSKRFEDKIESGSIYALSELEDTLTALNLPNDEYEKLFKHVSKTYISEIKWTNLDLLWVLQHIQKVNGIEETNYKKAVAPVKKVDGSKYERSE